MDPGQFQYLNLVLRPHWCLSNIYEVLGTFDMILMLDVILCWQVLSK